MSARYQTFALKLPSGRWVEVRPPSAAAALGQGVMLMPLLSAAVRAQAEADGTAEDAEPSDPLQVMQQFVGAILVRPRVPEELTLAEIPFADLYAIYIWAVAGEGQAHPWGEQPWRLADFRPMVTGAAAIHLDLMCSRYGVRPSIALGVAEADCAVDLDMAVAYRGLKRESDASSDEVTVEDPLGGKHRVPKRWLPTGNMEAGADALDLSRRGPGVYSVGGEGGDHQIGPMPRPGSFDRAGYAA